VEFHEEKKQIAKSMTQEDAQNEKLRVKIEYQPKMNITH
jgi:hypothetical protein